MSKTNKDLNIPADLKIPGHRIIRELGRGGMASVYLAMQESMDREVALKVMSPALGATDPSFSERFVREAKIVAKLSHPNVIAVYDVGIAGPYHYFSMEYHTGGDLKGRIHEGMMPKMALSITRQIASALAFAHSKGYVHRDVKPENVIFRHDGTALLTDFGIAKADDKANRMTATGTVIGTPHYMSPEQAQGLELDHRADIYSLGVMFYEMLTGTVPYAGTSALSIGIKHLKEPVPQFPPPLHVYQPLLNMFLAKNPDERFQSGEEVIAAIDAMSSGTQTGLTGAQTVVAGRGTGPQATVITTGQRARTQITEASPKSGSSRGLAIAAAVLVPVIAAGGYFYMRPASAPVPALAASAPATPRMNDIAAQAPAEATEPAKTEAKKEPDLPKPAAKKAEPPKKVASAAPPPVTPTAKPVDPSQEREQKLSGLIGRINEMLAPAGLTATRANLAGELYAEAAKLSPNDARVKNASSQIADAYLKLATARADEKNYREADNLVSKGLELAPNHRLLTALQKDIAERQKPKRQTFGGF